MTADRRFNRRAAKAIFRIEDAQQFGAIFAIEGVIRAGLTFDSKVLRPAEATS